MALRGFLGRWWELQQEVAKEGTPWAFFPSSIFAASILAANIFATYLIGYKAILPLKRRRLKGRENTWGWKK